MHAQTVSTRPLFGGEWPGDEATMFHDASFQGSVWHATSTNQGYKLVGGAMCEMKPDFCCLFYNLIIHLLLCETIPVFD